MVIGCSAPGASPWPRGPSSCGSWGQRNAPPDSIAQLSDRELEVFELHGRGLSTREMADAMDISPKTIATHRGCIKLAIDSTPELVRRAVLWIEHEKPAAGGPPREQ